MEALLAGGSTLVRHQNPHQHHGLQQDDGSTDTGDAPTVVFFVLDLLCKLLKPTTVSLTGI